MNTAVVLTYAVVTGAILGILVRPRGWPEGVWAVGGAVVLVVSKVLSPSRALAGVREGIDVYLFLGGMMLLAEVSREVGVFDWLAAAATRRARGSAARLFALVYAVGVVVTVFLSNDATAVVLTPAVAAAARTARVDKPMPHLFACAMVANAASFVLPISNPANLVVFGSRMPPLTRWLPVFALPSLVAIVLTYVLLRATQRRDLRGDIAKDVELPRLSTPGRVALAGIATTTVVLIAASVHGARLGAPTAICGALSCAVALAIARRPPWATVRAVSWSVLPLVAGLFVLVEGIRSVGTVDVVSALVNGLARRSETYAIAVSGLASAFGCNLVNNLPAGLVAGGVVATAHTTERVTRAVLIGIDLGPNLSVTGSLATILWLTALRREGHVVSAWTFLKVGIVVMPPTLVLAIVSACLSGAS